MNNNLDYKRKANFLPVYVCVHAYHSMCICNIYAIFVLCVRDLYLFLSFKNTHKHIHTHNLTESEVRDWNNTFPFQSVKTTTTLIWAIKSKLERRREKSNNYKV